MILRDARSAAPEPTTDPVAPVRLGVIDYLNVRPVYDWILRREQMAGGLAGIETVSDVPSAMNRALASGAVDISNVSSFAFGEHAGEWLLIPGLSVAAHGRVDSVLLFSWHQDWRDLQGAPIALTDHSATSIELVRLLCERRYSVRPRFTTTAPNLDTMLASHDAALLIGDIALVERHARREVAGRGVPYVFDLAAEWQAWTGLPFVFAVWAARAQRVDAVRRSGVVDLLRLSTRRGLDNIAAIAAAYSVRLGLSQAACADYLRLLDYELSARDLAGLRAYLEMAVPGFVWDSVRIYEG